MPDLSFEIVSVSAVEQGLTPMLSFDCEVTNRPVDERVHSIILQIQIRIQPLRRGYVDAEREQLSELFAVSQRIGPTMQEMVLAQVTVTIPSFDGRTSTGIEVPCTFDLNVATAKYLYGLQGGEVPLLFLFSGTVIYEQGGRMLIQPVPWDCECRFRMPLDTWMHLMDSHYPNRAWLYLRRDVFDRLNAYRRRRSLTSWDEAIEQLVASAEEVIP